MNCAAVFWRRRGAGVKGGESVVGSRVAKRWWDQDGLDLEGMWAAAWEAEKTEGGEETDGTETETDLISGKDTVANVILGTEPNSSLASAPGLELHHLIINMVGGHRGQLERERDREREMASLTSCCQILKNINLDIEDVVYENFKHIIYLFFYSIELVTRICENIIFGPVPFSSRSS